MDSRKTNLETPPAAINTVGESEVAKKVRALIAAGKCKQAVELAKDDHKRAPTAASEALLVQAYLARIEQFIAKGSTEDGLTLIKLVKDRFPKHAAALSLLELRGAGAKNDLATLLRPLAQEDVSPELRETVEFVLRREWIDLPALAASAVLPADHPLRVSAAAIWKAFVAVTSREVTDEQISLPEVSRRSPLAGWKMLIRAIVAFYRKDDEAARRALDGIAPDAAVRKLAPVLISMIERSPIANAVSKGADLQARVLIDDRQLQDALAKLEEAYDSFDPNRLIRCLRQAVSACSRSRPELLKKLCQQINVRCMLAEIPPSVVTPAIGVVEVNADFWRMAARGSEAQGMTWMGALFWERFLVHAIDEGLLTPNSPEAAVVYLQMATLAATFPRDDFRHMGRGMPDERRLMTQLYRDQPPKIAVLAMKTNPVLDPMSLFRKSLELLPDPKAFAQWFAYAERAELPERSLQEVVQLWQRKLPGDPQPPLLLSGLAELRKAPKLALKHLAEAEQIDAMNPTVRKARLRLTMTMTLRHLKDQKPHLLDADIAQLQALPAMREADRVIFLDALRVASLALRQEQAAMEAAIAPVVERAGPLLAHVLFASLGNEAGPKRAAQWPQIPIDVHAEPHAIVDAVIRLQTLATDLQFEVARPGTWNVAIEKVLAERPCPLTTAQLITLATELVENNSLSLAYSATVCGLPQSVGAVTARLLMLRAQSLEYRSFARLSQCFRAAMELAREANDGPLMSEISDEMEDFRGSMGSLPKLGEELLADVLKKERQATKFPNSPDDANRYVILMENESPFGGPINDWDDDFDDDNDDDDFEDIDSVETSPMPIIFNELSKILGNAPSEQDIKNLNVSQVTKLFQKLTGKRMDTTQILQMIEIMKQDFYKNSRRGKGTLPF